MQNRRANWAPTGAQTVAWLREKTGSDVISESLGVANSGGVQIWAGQRAQVKEIPAQLKGDKREAGSGRQSATIRIELPTSERRLYLVGIYWGIQSTPHEEILTEHAEALRIIDGYDARKDTLVYAGDFNVTSKHWYGEDKANSAPQKKRLRAINTLAENLGPRFWPVTNGETTRMDSATAPDAILAITPELGSPEGREALDEIECACTAFETESDPVLSDHKLMSTVWPNLREIGGSRTNPSVTLYTHDEENAKFQEEMTQKLGQLPWPDTVTTGVAVQNLTEALKHARRHLPRVTPQQERTLGSFDEQRERDNFRFQDVVRNSEKQDLPKLFRMIRGMDGRSKHSIGHVSPIKAPGCRYNRETPNRGLAVTLEEKAEAWAQIYAAPPVKPYDKKMVREDKRVCIRELAKRLRTEATAQNPRHEIVREAITALKGKIKLDSTVRPPGTGLLAVGEALDLAGGGAFPGGTPFPLPFMGGDSFAAGTTLFGAGATAAAELGDSRIG